MNGEWRPGRDRRAVRHLPPAPAQQAEFGGDNPHVVVVGGGIAGLAAATGLAEHGVRVTLLEAQDTLGGRVRSWRVSGPAGGVTMSRGFHAFFRQYYNLRALLRRADPALSRLVPIDDYPLQLAPAGSRVDPVIDSFTKVPRTPPWNLVGFVAHSPSFKVTDLTRVNVGAALGLLRVRFPDTYTDLDGVSAAEVLDRLRFPESARHLALEVFARSFFADPREFSGGELVAMFHTYFIGSAEGLLFDVPDDDYDTALWAPLGAHLGKHGVEVRAGTPARGVSETEGGVVVHTDAGDVRADATVLALDTAPLQTIVRDARWLGDPGWRDRIARLRTAPPFGVGRRWLAGSFPDVAPFLATSGYGPLDNISRLDAFEQGATDWAKRQGGTVVEVHGYALQDTTPETRDRLWEEAAGLHPELATAQVLAEQWLVEQDCPLVGTSAWRDRPTVQTPHRRVVLAGDLVRCDTPVALMERAATTGWQAANTLLSRLGRPGHTLWSPPMQGLLARRAQSDPR